MTSVRGEQRVLTEKSMKTFNFAFAGLRGKGSPAKPHANVNARAQIPVIGSSNGAISFHGSQVEEQMCVTTHIIQIAIFCIGDACDLPFFTPAFAVH